MDVSTAEVIGLANNLLQHVGIAKRVTTIRQCNSILFTQLYGALTGTRVPGIFPRAPSSEAVKCQAVVDALCGQLSPHISLDHIRGTDLARPDLLAVRNLLDIFSVLFSLPDREEEGEGEDPDEQHSEAEDSNVISSEGFSVISEVIREELGPSLSTATDSTAELLRPVPRARVPRMARPPRTWWEDSSISSMTAPSSSLRTSSSGRDARHESTPASSDETGQVYVERSPQLEISTLTSSDTDTLECQVVRHEPPIIVPSSSTVKRCPSPPPSPSTPPHQRLHVSPLHHSTPHTSTRSRVFGNHRPPSTHSPSTRSEEIPQVTNVATPALVLPVNEYYTPALVLPVNEYYTELTHPPRLEQAQPPREPVHVRRMPHSAPAETRAGERRQRGTQTGESSDHSPALVPAVSLFVQTESPPPDQELGVSQGSAIQDQTREERSPTPSSAHSSQSGEGEEEGESEERTPSPRAPPPRPRVHFSTSTQQRDSSRQEEPSTERTRLGEQMARTRTSVLAALYQNYLRELQASQPRRVGTPPPARRGTPTARRKASSGHHYRRTAHPTRKSARVSQTGHSSRDDGGSGSSEEEEGEREGEERGQRDSPTTIAAGDDMLPLVEREFPFVHVSPATVRRLWQKQLQQITALTKPAKPQSGRPSAAKQVAEMGRRHQALVGVIKKELDHTRRLQRQLEQRQQQQAVKANIRARRQAAARARKYFSEYELRLKAKLQKRRTREEQIFRRVFEDGLDLQRARVRELRQYSRERQQTQARQHQDQLESLENYYQDQFAMLAESTAKERESVAVREKAQHKLVQRLRRELRERLEREICQLQESLDREEDVAHFRELDAQQLRHKLNHVTFTTAVK